MEVNMDEKEVVKETEKKPEKEKDRTAEDFIFYALCTLKDEFHISKMEDIQQLIQNGYRYAPIHCYSVFHLFTSIFHNTQRLDDHSLV
jgi:hypothetical protein